MRDSRPTPPPGDVRPGKLLRYPSGTLGFVLEPFDEDARLWKVLEFPTCGPPAAWTRGASFLDGLEDA